MRKNIITTFFLLCLSVRPAFAQLPPELLMELEAWANNPYVDNEQARAYLKDLKQQARGNSYERADWGEQLEFEEAFESCLEGDELFISDAKQCNCIKKTVKNNLSEEDYKRAIRLKKEGRNGSARRIFKEAMSAAFQSCF